MTPSPSMPPYDNDQDWLQIMRPLHGPLPWRLHNHFQLHINAEAFIPRMLECIEAARDEILLEMYLMSSGILADRFIDALIRAADRRIRVHVLIDAFGSRRLSRGDQARMRRHGIQLRLYNPLRLSRMLANLPRDHRKLLLIDQQTAFVGGAGITDDFLPDDDFLPNSAQRLLWRETMIEAQGDTVPDWRQLFFSVWNNTLPPPAATAALPTPMQHTMAGRVAMTCGPTMQEITRSLLLAVRGCQRRLWISSPYFLPSHRLRQALIQASRRGVDVRLLLPGKHTDHPIIRQIVHRYYALLLRHRIQIHEYLPRFIHMKVVLCDHFVSIGSCNFDRWGLLWNLEANQEIRHPGFANQIAEMLEADFAESHLIDPSAWQARHWLKRAGEWFWKLHFDRVESWTRRWLYWQRRLLDIARRKTQK